MDWLVEQNEWTLLLFIIALIVDALVLNLITQRINKNAFVFFVFSLLIDALGAFIFYGYDSLFNFYPFVMIAKAIILSVAMLKHSKI